MPARKSKKSSVRSKSKQKDIIVPLTTLGIILILVVIHIFKMQTYPTSSSPAPAPKQEQDQRSIALPHPNTDSRVSLEKALNNRRSYRNFQNKPLDLSSLSQLLWSAQGITANWGGRTAFSFKSAYPLNIYVVSIKVNNLEPGLYQYNPGDIQPAHQLNPLYITDLQPVFLEKTKQYSLQHAPLILIITGNMDKMAEKYHGQRKDAEVYLEAGYVAQNLFLQSESLKLGMAIIRNTDQQQELKEILKIPRQETIIYLVPIGFPKK